MSFRLSNKEAWAMIARAHTGIFTTLRRDGRPVSLPVWHIADGGSIYLRTPAVSKKLIRIRNDPRANFLVEQGKAWTELAAVTVPVLASIVDDQQEATRVTAEFEAKYRDYELPDEQLPAPVRATYADMTVIRLTPDGRFLSWNNAALADSG